MEEILEKLRAPFPEEAIETAESRTGKGFEPTGVKGAYVIERLNEVFGLCGTGWSFEIQEVGVEDKWATARISLSYKIGEEWSLPVVAFGTSNVGTKSQGDAMKGAITDGIKKAASHLGVGQEAYKGLLGKNQKPRRKERRAGLKKEPVTEGAVSPDSGAWTWFWGTANGEGYSNEQVHARLECDSVNDWLKEEEGRTLQDAMDIVRSKGPPTVEG